MQTLLPLLSQLPFASLERVLVLNFSHENDLIFMRMNVQVTYIFIPIVSHKDSFCYRGKSKLGIGLFIHELLREPLICLATSRILPPLINMSSPNHTAKNMQLIPIEKNRP